jgi:hypothetical protein
MSQRWCLSDKTAEVLVLSTRMRISLTAAKMQAASVPQPCSYIYVAPLPPGSVSGGSPCGSFRCRPTIVEESPAHCCCRPLPSTFCAHPGDLVRAMRSVRHLSSRCSIPMEIGLKIEPVSWSESEFRKDEQPVPGASIRAWEREVYLAIGGAASSLPSRLHGQLNRLLQGGNR